jgi:general secretion pathway protein G
MSEDPGYDFSVLLDGKTPICWPSSCCVCGESPTWNQPLGGPSAYRVDVPHCTEHFDGAQLSTKTGRLVLGFRSLNYYQAFQELEKQASEAAAQATARDTEEAARANKKADTLAQAKKAIAVIQEYLSNIGGSSEISTWAREGDWRLEFVDGAYDYVQMGERGEPSDQYARFADLDQLAAWAVFSFVEVLARERTNTARCAACIAAMVDCLHDGHPQRVRKEEVELLRTMNSKWAQKHEDDSLVTWDVSPPRSTPIRTPQPEQSLETGPREGIATNTANTTACPACGESVESTLEKCPHCGEFLSERPPIERSNKKTLLVICAIGLALAFVVAAVAIGDMFLYYRGAVSTSRAYTAAHAKAFADMKALESAIGLYEADVAALPSNLGSLLTDPGTPAWNGPYLTEQPADPWGNLYGYTLNDDGKGFTLSSLGADNRPGGTSLDEDLTIVAR